MWRGFVTSVLAAMTLQYTDPFGTGKLVLFQVGLRWSLRQADGSRKIYNRLQVSLIRHGVALNSYVMFKSIVSSL
jgi:hypothetical protein